MTKLAFYFSLICSLSGILLIAPATPALWGVYSTVLVFHVVGGIGLLLMMVYVTFTHVTKGLKHMSKVANGRYNHKSVTGLWYFIVIVIVTATGIFMGIRSGFAVSWVVPLHLVAGLWCFLLSLKHSLKREKKLVSIKA